MIDDTHLTVTFTGVLNPVVAPYKYLATVRYRARGSGGGSILPGDSPLQFGLNEFVTLVPAFFFLGLSLGTQRQSFCSKELH